MAGPEQDPGLHMPIREVGKLGRQGPSQSTKAVRVSGARISDHAFFSLKISYKCINRVSPWNLVTSQLKP